jgi:hypothetical protein
LLAVPPLPVQCPRCAYDLSGQIATFTESCPLEGTCSECGLHFRWQELLDPNLAGPEWSFEHVRRGLIGRYFATLARVLMPARAWRGLTLTTMVHRGRLVLFMLATITLTQITLALVIMGSRSLNPTTAGIIKHNWHRYLAWPYGEGRMFSPLDGMPFGTPLMLITVTTTLAMPLSLLLLGETLSRHSVRNAHLLRGVCYSTVVAAAWLIATTICKNILRHTSGYSLLEGMTRHGATMPVLGLIYAALLGGWWWVFVARYLRVADAVLVTVVMMGVAYLGAMTMLIGLGVLIKIV